MAKSDGASMAGKKERMTGSIGALWGIMGVLVLLGSAVYRLTPLAIDAFSTPFSWFHWLAWGACIISWPIRKDTAVFNSISRRGWLPGRNIWGSIRGCFTPVCPVFLHGILPCDKE